VNDTSAPTIVQQLSRYITALRYEDLPADVVQQAKRLIVDTIGCALGGFDSEPARIARDIAGTVTSTQPVHLLVSGEPTSPDLAAFANGVAIRYLDFNDGYTSTGESGHPSDSVAAVLAAGELHRASGRDAILATVIAYEVFCRVCDARDLKPLGFDHTTVGGLASAAAAARLFGLPPARIEQALNLHVAANVALYQTRIGNVSMWKGCAYANASRNALFSTMLAARGMSGPSPVYEGVGGYFKAVTRGAFTLPAWGGSGHPFKIMECSIKRFPLGQYSQTVAEAALQLRERIGDPARIEAIHVATVSTAIRLMADDPQKWEPETRESADHSMPYTVAVALLHGEIGEEHFEDRYLHDPTVRALTRKVTVSESDEANRRMPIAMLCEMTIRLTSGATHQASIEYHRGHHRNPMSDAEVERKFRKLAHAVLPPAACDRLLERLWTLDAATDIGEVVRLTRADAAATAL
jgi:2-methylcitrate dehydratase